MGRGTTVSDNSGIVIPIDIEALCIGVNPGSIFEQNPFDFSKLKPDSAYLSSVIAAGGPNTLPQGVHLHWALPDALTQGAEGDGSVLFPAVPDRWLITRIFCDPDRSIAPQFDRWIIESNYYAPDNPNQALDRNAVAVPYQGDDWANQPWRYLGKVSDFTSWIKTNGNFAMGGPESYIAGLSAVGYGQADFAASYQNSQNILGFNDLGADLGGLGTAGSDKYLSYHILGWYSNPNDDPIRQLPERVPITIFNDLLGKVSDPGDKAFLQTHFQIVTYALIANVPAQTGQLLWKILQAAGYPLEVDIPLEIDPTEFQAVLANTTDPGDKATLQNSYLAALAPVSGLSEADKVRLWNIMATAGYDFSGNLLARAKWALPSGTAGPAIAPSYTLYSGLISNVVWNADTNYFTNDPANHFNIAIGNTAGEALSALIANTSGLTPEQMPVVEEILDALQAGILPLAKSESMLQDWELLEDALHQNSFGSARGGYLWEVQASKNTPESSGEVSLPASLAMQLNDLNISQLQLNELETSIASIRSQIFADWYRFMWVNYPGSGGDPSGGIDPGNLAQYIADKIGYLQPKVSDATTLIGSIDKQVTALRQALGKSYFLAPVTAPRYWQANDPVMLFQGEGIDPSDRYGNDGRYMYDGTLVCRLTGQLLSSLLIPAGAFGNTAALTLDATQFDLIPNPDNLPLLAGINATFVDVGLLNEDIIASQLRLAGVTTALDALAKSIAPLIEAFLFPDVPQQIVQAQFDAILAAISPEDGTFLESWYTLTGTEYVLNDTTPTDADTLRLRYILNSTSYNPSQAQLAYSGLPFSEVGMQAWDGNPWLPYSLQWNVNYFPLQQVPTKQVPVYPTNFITSQFKFGDTDLVYTGSSVNLTSQGIEPYGNTIFLTPHANINLQKQLSSFIQANPKDPLMEELKQILSKLGDKPVLSQAMSGFSEALLMLHKEMQLPVADPNSSPYYDFTNSLVHEAVADNNTQRPATSNTYNPIRVGLMQIASITLVDVFGRHVDVPQSNVIFRAQDMQQTVLTPASLIYLPPRLTQASRLLFRWLSANEDTVEMNTHPATTPICGWVLTNPLDNSLWIYDSKGNAYGALILNWDKSRVLWQCTPGSIYFGLDAPQFFNQLGVVNGHLKDFVLALYGDGGQASAAYLSAFMRALDVASTTIEPGNYAQYQANAALLGRPLALVRASLNLELMGEPAYNQSWPDLANQVTQDVNQGNFIWGNEYGFTNVNFPVKIGNIPQTSDGLVGYFKDNDYGTFYSPEAEPGNPHILPPADDNLVVNFAADTPPVVISMLVEPRGVIHATTGILPVKTIDIPPDQYVDALEKLSLAFLTAPLLTSKSQLALPLPAQNGGSWTWVENDGTAWAQNQQIAPLAVDAVMNYAPQEILEGWLNLSNVLLSTALFKLINNKSGTALLYITDDPGLNGMTFTFTNLTNAPLNLAGGAPVSRSYQAGGSSIAFNFGTMLPASVLAGMQVSADGWAARYFPATAQTPALWSLAPNNDMSLARGASVTFTLQGITCPPGTVAGNFQIYYYGLPDVPDGVAPLLLPVAVEMPPTR